MEVRSAINILFSKFNINYRVFLYLFVVTAIVIAIAASAVMPTFNEVIKNPETTESFTAVTNTFADYLRGQTTFSQVIASGKTFYHTVIDLMNATNATAAFWVTVVVVSFFIRLAMSFCYPAISDVISNFMSSNMSYGLLSNILKNFSLCAKYAFFHTIITMVTDIAIFFAIYGVIKLFFPIIGVFAFALALVCAVVLIALRLTFSSGVIPEMVVGGEKKYFGALKTGFSYMKKYFGKIFGANCIVIFVIYSLIMLMTLITFGVAFFVLGSMLVTYIHVMQLVFYYESKSMRYYTDAYTIVNTAPISERIDLQDELLRKDD